jgi:FixJ family two-component response regulator
VKTSLFSCGRRAQRFATEEGKSSVKRIGTAARVAVIDDDVSIREALTALLNSWGYDTVAFASAMEIIAFDVRENFACLLIDMHMPDMTGLDLLRWLSKTGTASRAILMSSEGAPGLNQEASRLGAHAFIEKTLGFEKIIEAVDDVVRPLRGG